MMYSLLFLIRLLAFNNAMAIVCPDKVTAPKCPTSGTTLLDETYPTQAFVISNMPSTNTKESEKFSKQLVKKIIKSYNYKNIPQIIYPTSYRSNFQELTDFLRKDLASANLSKEEIEKIISQVSQAKTEDYKWQQDWFESFIDLKTGSPVLRKIESYGRDRILPDINKMTISNILCPISKGDALKSNMPSNSSEPLAKISSEKKSFLGGEMGGNIEGAPGGFCMVGDNQGREFTKQFCGSDENIIQLQTSWLSAGHVDEILKIVPTKHNDGRPSECEFAVLASSPEKAFSLMKSSPLSKTPFVKLEGEDPIQMRSTRTNLSDGPYPEIAANYKICNYIQNYIQNNSSQIKKSDTKSKSVFWQMMLSSDAFAEAVYKNFPKNNKLLKVCEKHLETITNFEMQEVMQTDTDLVKLNKAIQESVNSDKKLVRNKILSRLPQCAKYYDEVNIPSIFYGTSPIAKKGGGIELTRPGHVTSLLPNQLNSVVANKTLITPDSTNDLFNNYFSSELSKRKIDTDFLASWDYAHTGKGNIHCVSHSITYCRP